MKKSRKVLKTLSMIFAMLLVLPSIVCLVSANTSTETGTYITNVALGKTASASSYESTERIPSYGNDGSTSSLWVANNGNPGNWWMVDLGTVYSIHGSEIEFEYEGDIWQYLVEVSSDGTAWTSVVDKSENTSSTKIQTDLFTAVARYVRVTITGLPSSRWAAFSEFRVWGEEAISITGTNVALQKTVSAISQESVDRAVSNIVDPLHSPRKPTSKSMKPSPNGTKKPLQNWSDCRSNALPEPSRTRKLHCSYGHSKSCRTP